MIDFTSVKSLTISEGVVTAVTCMGKVLWQKQKEQPYKRELAYLEGTGTQWINTGIRPTDSSIKSEVKIAYSSTSTGQLMGAGTSGTERFNFGIESGKFRFGFGGSWFDANSEVKTPDTEPHIWVLDAEAKAGYIDGVEQKTTNTYLPGGSRAFILFARGSNVNSAENGNRTKGKLYYAKLWDKGNLVRHLIPVLDWDDVPCMYDKVSGELFYNRGTGEFVFENLAYKQELAYLEGTGAQWIDTGVVFEYVPPSIAVKFRSTSYSSGDYTGYYVGAMNNGSRGIGVKKQDVSTVLVKDYSRTATTVPVESSAEWNEVFVNRKDMTLTADGTTVKLNGYRWYGSNPVSYALFATKRYNGTIAGVSKCAIAYCQLFDNNMNLVRDFIPVLDWDDVPCMYDKVSGKLFYNQGTGKFLTELDGMTYSDAIDPVDFGMEYTETYAAIDPVDFGMGYTETDIPLNPLSLEDC